MMLMRWMHLWMLEFRQLQACQAGTLYLTLKVVDVLSMLTSLTSINIIIMILVLDVLNDAVDLAILILLHWSMLILLFIHSA